MGAIVRISQRESYRRRPVWTPAGPIAPVLNLTATTTGVAEMVTLTRLTTGLPSRIWWGDGSVETIAASSTAVLTHVYAAAAVYPVVIEKANYITGLQLETAKIGGLNTAQLRYSILDSFFVALITGSTIRSADMVAWRPNVWIMYSMPAGTYTIASADMVAWRPIFWVMYSMPAGTYTIASADMVAWRPTFWRIYSMPAAGSSYTFAVSCMRAWTLINEIRADGLGLNAAAVDTILTDVYAGKATFTFGAPALNVAGTNAAPSGVYASVCPPTTGKETAFDLVNGICIAAGPEWAVTYTP